MKLGLGTVPFLDVLGEQTVKLEEVREVLRARTSSTQMSFPSYVRPAQKRRRG